MKLFHYKDKDFISKISNFIEQRYNSNIGNHKIDLKVKKIINDIKKNGDSAIKSFMGIRSTTFASALSELISKMFLYFYRKYVGIVVAYLPTQGFKHWLRGPIRSSALMSPSDTVASELLDAWHLSVWNLKTWPALWCPSQSKCFT